ncbi:acyl-CoA thioesterase [Nakamurella deserti]|uniref:acyl-CoA thioesterase n=1 Tax=Nakamurella deserti TaxID=2164074 RepID=UPI000DBE6DE2|nr:acyl-CoA thioesterase [Nakamurella deserti]
MTDTATDLPGRAGIGEREITLRFLAAPTDVALIDSTAVAGGRVLEWIDKAAYACAVGWSGGYCVTAYVGNVSFTRPINSGELVEVLARLVYTGRSSMHIEVLVSSADPQLGVYTLATSCTVIFVAVGDDGRPVPVQQWEPVTDDDRWRGRIAREKIAVRADVEAAMKEQTYTDDTAAQQATLRFLAAPTDVNWGGKTHGGTVMRWIDEAAYVCAAGWSGQRSIAIYSGGIRFYRPILIGHLVEVQARLLYTGRSSMHVSVHVRSGDPKAPELQLTTHCLSVFVALDADGRTTKVRPWVPQTDEDRRLDAHAQHLVKLRARLAPPYPV